MSDKHLDSYTIYIVYKILTKERKDTGMHITICYRNECNDEILDKIKKDLENINIKGYIVKIIDYIYLGYPIKNIEACSIIIHDNNHIFNTSKIREFNNKYSYRKDLDHQFDFNLHMSLGRIDSEEHLKNKNTIEKEGIDFIIGDGYIKNLDTKKIIYEF